MPKYKVTIEATIRKLIEVEAENETQAYEEAHEVFSVAYDDNPENYTQDAIRIEEVQ